MVNDLTKAYVHSARAAPAVCEARVAAQGGGVD